MSRLFIITLFLLSARLWAVQPVILYDDQAVLNLCAWDTRDCSPGSDDTILLEGTVYPLRPLSNIKRTIDDLRRNLSVKPGNKGKIVWSTGNGKVVGFIAKDKKNHEAFVLLDAKFPFYAGAGAGVH